MYDNQGSQFLVAEISKQKCQSEPVQDERTSNIVELLEKVSEEPCTSLSFNSYNSTSYWQEDQRKVPHTSCSEREEIAFLNAFKKDSHKRKLFCQIFNIMSFFLEPT